MAILLLESHERSIHGTQGCINEADSKGVEATESCREDTIQRCDVGELKQLISRMVPFCKPKFIIQHEGKRTTLGREKKTSKGIYPPKLDKVSSVSNVDKDLLCNLGYGI